MSGLELYVDDIEGRLTAAVMEKGRLNDLYIDGGDMTGTWASIYLGKVTKIDNKLDAAIVDLGNGLSGFLPAKHVHFQDADASEARSGIGQLLKPGQMVMVQIKSEARKGSRHEQQKMPRLTTKIYIIGQFCVYCPIASRVTMSRRLTNESIIAFTAKLKNKGGWIIQQNADNAAEADILQETSLLEKEWDIICAARDASRDQPRMLRAGPNALYRALADYGARNFDHIHVADRQVFDMMAQWCAKHDPALATSKRLRLFKPEKLGQRLFDIHDLYGDLEALEDSLIPLPGGGGIIIEQTHAMVVIDVNQGSTGSIVEANVQAAAEVARQLRLRNLSGAIVVDFINMGQRSERARVLEALERAFETDSSGPIVHGFTRIGIVEITRKRRSGAHTEKKPASQFVKNG